MRRLSLALIGGGSLLLLVSGGFWVYGAYETTRARADVAALLAAMPTPDLSPGQAGRATVEPVPTASPVEQVPADAPTVSSSPDERSATADAPWSRSGPSPEADVEWGQPTVGFALAPAMQAPTSTPIPTPTPVPQPVRRITVPTIGLDSPVVESKIVNGEWTVPKFVAGHLEGTAQPGSSGNIVLAGHVESISSGNVFARIGELKKNDLVLLTTDERTYRYHVVEQRVVRNDDLSVVQPSVVPIVTLITCTGTWNPITRDYSHRLVVIAELEPAVSPAGR